MLQEAVRYWEKRRIAYNLVLFAVVVIWIAATWPHFAPALKWSSLAPMAALALAANLCYCAAYPADFLFQISPFRRHWPRYRGTLWTAGAALAVLLACYWIGDEIYPYV